MEDASNHGEFFVYQTQDGQVKLESLAKPSHAKRPQ